LNDVWLSKALTAGDYYEETKTEDASHAELLLQLHLQPRDHRYWQAYYDDIGEDVDFRACCQCLLSWDSRVLSKRTEYCNPVIDLRGLRAALIWKMLETSRTRKAILTSRVIRPSLIVRKALEHDIEEDDQVRDGQATESDVVHYD
jgi:hypothetical protein